MRVRLGSGFAFSRNMFHEQSSTNSQRATQRRFLRRLLAEQLEDRRLLSADLMPVDIVGLTESDVYDQVAPSWFATFPAEPVQAVKGADASAHPERQSGFVGPQQLLEFEWIVRLDAAAAKAVSSLPSAATSLDAPGAQFEVLSGLGLPGLLLVRSLSGSQAAAESSLRENASVTSYSLNEVIGGAALPNDPDFSSMVNLHNVGQFGATVDADIDAPEAWDVTKGSTTVVVGVIDSGVDATHPDLYQNIWLNQGEIPSAKRAAVQDTDTDGLITFYDLNAGANAAHVRDLNGNGYIDALDLLDDPLWADGSDTDRNGFVDDFFGWNFRDAVNEPFAPNNPSDNLGHGTHVAGTIGAMGNNARGITGLNWRSSIMALKFLDENNQGDTASAISAINYASMMRTQFNTNVRVLNNSWGQPGSPNPLLRNAIEASSQADILFVAAAGNGNILGQGVDNDKTPFFPAGYEVDSVIAVGASDGGDRLAGFSNYGLQSVDIIAPGVGVRSTLPGGRYGEANGTSMATPHVAGAAALLSSLQPNATAIEVRQALLEKGDSIPAIGSQVSTGRRLNLQKSLAADVFAPTVQLVSASNITTAGGVQQLITVLYKNRLGVDKASLGNADLVVIRQAALDETFTTTFVSSTENAQKTEVTAIYRLGAVGGSWDAGDYGNYSIVAKSDAARSISGLASRETTVGSFQVKIAAAGIYYVDTLLDTVDVNPGDGLARDAQGRTSLRAAIMEANARSPQAIQIYLQTGTYPLSIAPVIDPSVVYPVPGPGSGYDAPAGLGWSNASTGDLDLKGNITLVGLGVNRTTIDAADIDRVMKVYPGSTVSITGLTLTGGNAPANHSGGGILNSGNLSLDLATIKSNVASNGPSSLGGGIAHWNGNLNIYRSTLDSNTAIGGGGAFVTNAATAKIDSSTLMNNIADGNTYSQTYQMGGGGVLTRNSGRVEINNSTLSDNSAAGIALGDAIRNSHGSRDADAFPAQISGDGRYIAMAAFGRFTETATSPFRNIYLYDRVTGDYELVSVDTNGVPANGESIISSPGTAVNNGGRYVVFQSHATNLVSDDNNVVQDIFLRDRAEGSTTRISVASSGAESNEQAGVIGISRNGNAITFMSFADNLVPGDTNGTKDVFVYDIPSKTTRIVSVNEAGQSSPGDHSYPTISADGRFVSFQSDGNTLVPNDRNQVYDAFVKDMQTGFVDRVSVSSQGVEGNSHSSIPSLSASGRFVAYYSLATNLVDGDNNGKVDIFVFDRETRTTRLVSKTIDGIQSNADSSHPTISGNGRFVVFNSDASNLVPNDTNGLSDFFWVDTETAEIIKIPFDGPLATFAKATISDDGRWVNFSRGRPNFAGVGDSDNQRDSYTFDTVTRILVQDTPREGIDRGYYDGITVSGSNRFVTYTNWGTDNLGLSEANVLIRDTFLNTTTLISRGQDGQPANGSSAFASADDNGNIIVFTSAASNLISNDSNSATDLFLFNRTTEEMRRIATSDPANSSFSPSKPRISGNGKTVVFASEASHLVAGDTNSSTDIFVYDVVSGITKIVSHTFDKLPANGASSSPVISGDGKTVSFVSTASNLVPGDTNGLADLFVVDLESETIQLVSKAQDGQLANQSMPTDNSVVSSVNYDGSKIAFVSSASNLVPGDSNGVSDVFMFNRNQGQMTRMNLGEFATEANGVSYRPSISSDGRYVGYISSASNIVSTIQTPAAQVAQYFIHDTLRQTTDQLALVSPQSLFGDFSFDGPAMSPQFSGPDTVAMIVGRTLTTVNLTTKEIVAHKKKSLPEPNSIVINWSTIYSSTLPSKSIGQELIDGDMTVTNSIVSIPSTRSDRAMSAFRNESMPTYFNTSFVALGEIDPLANNGGSTLTHRIPLTSNAFQAIRSFQIETFDQRGQLRNGLFDAGAFETVGSTISGRVFLDANGNKSFDIDEVGISGAQVFVDVDRDGIRSEEELSTLTFPDNLTTVSANESGEFTLENIPPGYVAVVATKNGLLSEPTRGQDPLPTSSSLPSMGVSGDGRYVVFSSDEKNLVPNDTNGERDVFMWDRATGKTKRLSLSSSGAQANNASDFASISSDGSVVAFQSAASNLVAGDTNGVFDVFLHYVNTGITRRLSVDQSGLQEMETHSAISRSIQLAPKLLLHQEHPTLQAIQMVSRTFLLRTWAQGR
jgi:subtilisin family serine protease